MAEAVIVKDAGGATVNAIVTVALRLPEVPVTVTVDVPAGALAPATKVNVLALDVPPGLNEAVTPVGKPDTARATVPLNPPVGATVMDAVALELWTTVTAGADVVKPNPGAAVTTKFNSTDELTVPETPCTAIQ